MEFTPSTVLAPFRPPVWDVNGYYADLGIATDASRREIKEAYQALRGHESERLTYVVKQLLNDDVRARYDTTPLGSVFFDDYIKARVKDRIAEQVKTMREKASEVEEADLFEEIDLDEMLNARSFEVVDSGSQRGENPEQPVWHHYVWQTGGRRHLAPWLALLGQAFTEQGVHERIAVGFHRVRGLGSVEVTRLDHRTIVFFDDREQPSIELARQAVEQVTHGSRLDHRHDTEEMILQ
jgi:hypothetical protein